MAEIKPFKGVLYNVKKVSLEKVVSPPYDVISREEQLSLLKKSPYNVVRLILGQEEGWIKEAAKLYQKWRSEGILIKDELEALYPYYLEYSLNGRIKIQKGLVARVRIEPLEKGVILPHEKTFSKTVSERLSLLKETKVNLSQVYGVYDDASNQMLSLLDETTSKSEPLIEVEYEGIKHRLWRLTDKRYIQKLQTLMASKRLIIADGHHRYRTALAYKEEMQRNYANAPSDAPFNFVSMFLSCLEDEGLSILPIHRLLPPSSLPGFDWQQFLKEVSKYFEIHTYDNETEFLNNLRSFQNKKTAIGCYSQFDKSRFYLFVLNRLPSNFNLPEVLQKLDVKILTKIILGRILGLTEEELNQEGFIEYAYCDEEALKAIREGQFVLGFILNPTTSIQLKEVVFSGHLMPRKSTCFYPKLLTGLLFNELS